MSRGAWDSHAEEKGSLWKSGVRAVIAAFWTDSRFEARGAERTWRGQRCERVFGLSCHRYSIIMARLNVRGASGRSGWVSSVELELY